MEDRDVSPRSLAREKRLADIEKVLFNFVLVLPIQVTLTALALMLGLGAAHDSFPVVPALGWWTSVGVSFGWCVIMMGLVGWFRKFVEAWRRP